MNSGYTTCTCRDCFDITVGDMSKPELCGPCEAADCIPYTDRGDVPDSHFECQREDAYEGSE